MGDNLRMDEVRDFFLIMAYITIMKMEACWFQRRLELMKEIWADEFLERCKKKWKWYVSRRNAGDEYNTFIKEKMEQELNIEKMQESRPDLY